MSSDRLGASEVVTEKNWLKSIWGKAVVCHYTSIYNLTKANVASFGSFNLCALGLYVALMLISRNEKEHNFVACFPPLEKEVLLQTFAFVAILRKME